jgi:hypothetical protein
MNIESPTIGPSEESLAESNASFERLLLSLDLTDDDVAWLMSAGVTVDTESHCDGLDLRPSVIHGTGVFASVAHESGSEWLAASEKTKFVCGRFINHSEQYNCELFTRDGEVFCRATENLPEDAELLCDYTKQIDKEVIDAYKESRKAGIYAPKVPSLVDWEKSSQIDRLEYQLSQMKEAELPLTHFFTPGIYIRMAFAPAGSMFTTVHHNTEHPFILISGITDVISQDGSARITGPYLGFTQPGTRRVVYAVTDALYLTIHANHDDIQDPDEIIERITLPVENPLMHPDDPRFNTWRKDISPSVYISNKTNNLETKQ